MKRHRISEEKKSRSGGGRCTFTFFVGEASEPTFGFLLILGWKLGCEKNLCSECKVNLLSFHYTCAGEKFLKSA